MNRIASQVRGKGRPKLAEAAEIDRVIRDAALKVLLEQGQAATLNAVAVAAGLSRKTVYARYPNKEELFLVVIRSLMEDAESIAYDASGDAEHRLLNYIEAMLRIISRPESKAIQHLVAVNPTYIAVLRAELLQTIHRLFFVPLHEIVSSGVERGEFVVDDLDATTRVIMNLILAESVSHERDENGSSGDEAGRAQLLANLLTRGLIPRPDGVVRHHEGSP
ncbi:MAG: TetR/AcrR family transcriptional regulator [Rhizorhabdus sp.]